MTETEGIAARFRALLGEACALSNMELLRDMQDQIVAAARAMAPQPDAEVGWHGMIGNCSLLVAMHKRIEKFAAVTSPVLILGESGTGKDQVAKILHLLSTRRDGPMVAENCAAIPESLLESVLFGHVRGAFTGADRDHPGHFRAAHKGVIFLDEIGEMPPMMQSKLLRVLQEGEVRPVGGEKPTKVDVRVIAATNRDLAAMVKSGGFREDLYYRLNVLVLDLPPLRERGGDVALLLTYLLAELELKTGKRLVISAEAKRALEAYDWPGNIRQLQNEVLRLGALCAGREVSLSDLSPAIGGDAIGGELQR